MTPTSGDAHGRRQQWGRWLGWAWCAIVALWLGLLAWAWFRGIQVTGNVIGWHVFSAGFGHVLPLPQNLFMIFTPLVWIGAAILAGTWFAFRPAADYSVLALTGAEVDAHRVARQTRRLRFPLLAWVAIALPLGLLQTVDRFVADGRRSWVTNVWMNFASGLNQFDGPEYLNIARHGYEARQLVWFPFYPLLIRAGHLLGLSAATAAVLITLAASLAAGCLFWVWLERRIPETRTRKVAWLALMLYPYSWFLYGVVYADALFVCLLLAACVMLDRDRLLLGGIAGALAAATRPSGLMFCGAWLILVLDATGVLILPNPGTGWAQRWRFPLCLDTSKLRVRHVLALVPFLGWGAYVLYTAKVWNSPFAYVLEQERYHGSGLRLLLKQQFFEQFSYPEYDFRFLSTITFQAIILVIVLASVAPVGRRFGWGYAAMVLGLAAMPAISVSTFMGVGRYLIPCFPSFALFGEWLYRHRLARWWLPLSGGLLALLMLGFSRSWYLS